MCVLTTIVHIVVIFPFVMVAASVLISIIGIEHQAGGTRTTAPHYVMGLTHSLSITPEWSLGSSRNY
jgi:hypothetical protein